MDDFYSREITLADMPFLMHEFEEGARLGHFTNEIITPAGGKKFEKQTREAIKTRDAEGYSGHFIFILGDEDLGVFYNVAIGARLRVGLRFSGEKIRV